MCLDSQFYTEKWSFVPEGSFFSTFLSSFSTAEKEQAATKVLYQFYMYFQSAKFYWISTKEMLKNSKSVLLFVVTLTS